MSATVDETERDVCFECGVFHGKRPEHGRVSSYHEGICSVCGAAGSVTSENEFGGVDVAERHSDRA